MNYLANRLCGACLPVLMALSPVSYAENGSHGADHHMHIRSQNASDVWAALCESMPQACGPDYAGPPAPLDVDDVIAVLDEAGLEKGVVLSLAYFYGFPELSGSDYDNPDYVREENRFVAEQIARYPDRLAGFFSVNPSQPYALEEVGYWAEAGGLAGLKLHLANSNLDFHDPDQVVQLQKVLALLAEHQLPLVVHLRNRNPEYGAFEANTFINAVAESAPGLTLHIAHMAGWGGYDEGTDAALGAFIQAFEDGRLDRDRVYFDLAAVVMAALPDEALAPLPARMRQIGIDHILFATDWDAMEAPKEYIQALKSRLDLTEAEWEVLLANQAPYLE